MAQDRLILDVNALESICTIITSFLKQTGESIDELVANVSNVNGQWNDMEFELILKLIREHYVEFEKLSSRGTALVQKAKEKINMIKSLHNIDI